MGTHRIISAEDRLAAANLRRIWNERHRRLGLTFAQQRAVLAQLREQNRANDQLLRQLLARGRKPKERPA